MDKALSRCSMYIPQELKQHIELCHEHVINVLVCVARYNQSSFPFDITHTMTTRCLRKPKEKWKPSSWKNIRHL